MKTIIECMYSIIEKMRDPESESKRRITITINKDTTRKAAAEIRFLKKALNLSQMQVLMLTAIIQNSACFRMDADDVAHFLGMEYLQFLTHDGELQELRKRGYIRMDNEGHINVPKDALDNLKANRALEPEPTTGLSAGKMLARIKKLLSLRDDDSITTDELNEELDALVEGNPETSLVRAYKKYVHRRIGFENIVFFGLVYRYWYERDNMVGWHDFRDYFTEDELCDIETAYRSERLYLQRREIIEYVSENGMLTKDYFHIKDSIMDEVLEDLGGVRKKEVKVSASRKLEANSINRKQLFYNQEEGKLVARLADLLSEKSFDGIRERMKEKGLRSGFTCLFYGSPGTGKTETVYQIARESGRDLFIVDVSQIKSCWVGESEKNIKEVFNKYRQRVEKGGKVPILLFNEADAIFGIRQQGAENAVDKMENSIQNIILQEMEDLDGILIATTNLTENLDSAFERRFLYKIRFSNPSAGVKKRICKSMIPELTDVESATLAEQFDLSGGQIENVSRKKTIQAILSGEEPTLDELIAYCKEEVITPGKDSRRIGF